MKDSVKFWVSSLGIPIVLALVGYFINNSLQANQQALDKIKFSDQMVTEVFDTSNVDKSMARVELLPYMVDDKKFVTTLTNLVVNFWVEKAKEAAVEGNDSVFEKIYTASKNFKQEGKALKDSLEENPQTRKADSAYIAEQDGLHYLQLGKLDEAKKSFEYSKKEQQEFHSTDKILSILKTYSKPVSDSESSAIGQEVLGKIKTQYAYKFHAAKAPVHAP
jgi:hypothetical protein